MLTEAADVFYGLPGATGAPTGRYAILPSPDGRKATVVLLLLSQTPIKETVQLQYHVFTQQPTTYFVLAHNLLMFYWGEPITNLENKQISVSYFADLGDQELIHSLNEHDGRWFADDQPLPKFNQPDSDFKGNKWMPLIEPAAKP